MKHLLSIDDLSRLELEELMRLTAIFDEVLDRDVPVVSALRGKNVVLGFFENSTRTKMSFELAAKSLSAGTMNFAASSSSTNKGESLKDTVETISAMEPDLFIVRHASSGVPAQITRWTDAGVISAGDGTHSHPTQGLLDVYTAGKELAERNLGSLEGKRVAFCGDLDQRVARSSIAAFAKLGAEVLATGPATMIPPHFEKMPIKLVPDIDSVLGEIDVLYLLRIQKERKGKILLPSLREYRQRFGISVERQSKLRDDCLIMHPGPINRGVELDEDVTNDARSVITNQVRNGIPTRMAVIFKLLASASQVEKLVTEQGQG